MWEGIRPSYENVQLLLLYFFEYDTIFFFFFSKNIWHEIYPLKYGIVKYRSLDSHSHQQCTFAHFKIRLFKCLLPVPSLHGK